MEPLDPLEPIEIVAGRFQLRPPSLREAEDLVALAEDPATRLWGPIGGVTTLDEAREWCRKWSDWNGGEAAEFVVFDAIEGRLMGIVALQNLDVRNRSAGVGFHVAPWARGKGVATTAVKSVLQWGFGALDLARIQLIHAVGNTASCRVAERAGFAFEGETRSSYRYGDGQLHNEHLHARLATD